MEAFFGGPFAALLVLLLLLCGGSFALSLLLTPLCARFALRLRMVDNPGERKIHVRITPYGGGLAIWFSLFLCLTGCYLALAFFRDWLPAGVATLVNSNLPGLRDPIVLRKLAGIGGGSLLIFGLGLVDDLRPLPAKFKLFVQILAALVLWYCGLRITAFIDSAAVSLLLTVGWVVLITNAFNLLDNMDGLSAGVALLAGLHLLLISALTGHLFIAAFLAIFCGCCGGFLRHNFAPAKLFMGDAGSLLLGFLLASASVAGTFCDNLSPAHAILIPILVLGVPLFDTASVIVIRLRSGKSIFVGDTNHLSHRLTRLGFSRRSAVLVIYLLCFIFGQCALLLPYLHTLSALAVFIIALAITLLMALLMAAHPRDPA